MECPRCDAASPLEKVRVDQHGSAWYCTCCSALVIVNAAGRIVHVGTK